MYSFNNIACINVHHRTWPQVLSLAGGQIDPGTKKLSGEALGRRIFRDAFDLHADPYERADVTSNTYYDWFISQPYIVFAAQAVTAKFLDTFKEFPPRQRAASFSIDQAVDAMKKGLGSTN